MMTRLRFGSRPFGLFAAILLAAPLAALAAGGAAPAVGEASGTFTVDGKAVSFTRAYARPIKDSEGKAKTAVLLTDKAVPAALLKQADAKLSDVLQAAQVNGLTFQIAADGQADNWSWVHPGLSIGCGFCSELQVKLDPKAAGAIGGEAFSTKKQTFMKQSYEFRARFKAALAAPAAAAKK
jgi:hypothetical protein